MGILHSLRKRLETDEKKVSSRNYSGAAFSRLVSDWIATNSSADSEVNAALSVLRNRCRELARNNEWVKAFLLSLEINIIGRKGIRLQSRVKNKKGELDRDINKLIESEWLKWCRSDSCDVEGRRSFNAICRLLVRVCGQDGESALIRIVYRKFGRSKIPFSLQILESDRLDETFNRTASPGQNAVRMGVELNEFNRPVAYWVLAKHPGDMSVLNNHIEQRRVRYEAREIIHFFLPERPEQTRAVPWLSAVMGTIRQLKGYIDAAVIRKRVEAIYMWWIKSPDGDAPAGQTMDNQRITDAQPAQINYLGPGEDLAQSPMPSNPSNDAAFTTSLLQNMAAGTGASYESISRDYSKTNYSSSRLSLISEREAYQILQDWFIENFMQPVFEKFVEAGVIGGVFPFNDHVFDPDKYDQPKWLPRGWQWIDPQKDVLANKEALKSNLTTMSKVLGESGEDFEETMEQRKYEEDFIKNLGLKSDLTQEIVTPQKQNQSTPEDEE